VVSHLNAKGTLLAMGGNLLSPGEISAVEAIPEISSISVVIDSSVRSYTIEAGFTEWLKEYRDVIVSTIRCKIINYVETKKALIFFNDYTEMTLNACHLSVRSFRRFQASMSPSAKRGNSHAYVTPNFPVDRP
jgi:hypothetical protein